MTTQRPSFEELFVASWPRLVRAAYAVTRDRQTAEDVVQVAFVKAHAAWWRVGRADDPLAYVRRIAINTAISQQRRLSHQRERPTAQLPDAGRESFEDDVLARDEVWAAIGTLPPRQRAVVVLRYYEDLSEREIAEVLGCRPGTVKSQASAALHTLRARLGASYLEGDPT